MSAHGLIRYPFGGTSIVRFDAYGRSVLRHRRPLNFSACGYSAPARTRKWELLFLCSFAQGDWGGVVCNQEMARVVGSLSALQAGKAKEALRQPLSFSSCLLALPDEKITMRKYLLSVLAIIAATIIAAETAELALDANGNTAKILIPNIKDHFSIEEDD
jgi:hypothetical protein